MTFRVLLIGLGNRGATWADLIGSNGDLSFAAVMDVDPERLSRFAARHPGVPAFTDLDEALAAEADAAILVTPPDGHLDQARRIFAAGLPLLCEKPLSTDLAEAVEIVGLADAACLPLTIGLNFRYLPVSQALRDLFAREAFGAPGFGQFTYQRNRDGRRVGLNKYPLMMRHPMMLEQSIHHLDLIRFCYGREAVSVTCRTWNPPWSMYAHDANVSCLLTLEGGLEVSYLGTWAGGWNELRFQWRTDCSGGVVIQRRLFCDLATARTADAALTDYPLAEAEPFIDDTRALLTAFVDAVRAGRPAPCDGRDHLRTLALCFAAVESSETGRRVDMRDFLTERGIEASP